MNNKYQNAFFLFGNQKGRFLNLFPPRNLPFPGFMGWKQQKQCPNIVYPTKVDKKGIIKLC